MSGVSSAAAYSFGAATSALDQRIGSMLDRSPDPVCDFRLPSSGFSPDTLHHVPDQQRTLGRLRALRLGATEASDTDPARMLDENRGKAQGDRGFPDPANQGGREGCRRAGPHQSGRELSTSPSTPPRPLTNAMDTFGEAEKDIRRVEDKDLAETAPDRNHGDCP